VAIDIITQQVSPDLWGYAEKIASGADSILARLDQADFDRGLAVLRAYAATVPPQPVYEPIDVFVFQ
jgi:hypothetical protein